jgi:hypothetical protein
MALECESLLLSEYHSLAEYFEQAKWIFILNEKLYQEYLRTELRPAIQNNILLVAQHGNPDLLALRDQDILQIALQVIYHDKKGLTLGDADKFTKLQLHNLSSTPNQASLL